jgi:hypothetical protein
VKSHTFIAGLPRVSFLEDGMDVFNEAPEGVFVADVIQFMRPDGRRVSQTVHLAIDFEDAYREMMEAGYRFEAEVLQTNHVSVTVANGERDADIKVVENGPAVKDAMEQMLNGKRWIDAHD